MRALLFDVGDYAVHLSTSPSAEQASISMVVWFRTSRRAAPYGFPLYGSGVFVEIAYSVGFW
jgi:hypothetical protein